MASRLIPLGKKTGLRPIGVGEVAGKAVMMLFKNDLPYAAGALQLSTGRNAGIEATVLYTLCMIFFPKKIANPFY